MSNIQWVRDAREADQSAKDQLSCQGGQMERWPLPGAALGSLGWQLCCCAIVQDRLELEPAMLLPGCSPEGSVGLTTSCQPGRDPEPRREGSPAEGTAPLAQAPGCSSRVHARKTSLKQVPSPPPLFPHVEQDLFSTATRNTTFPLYPLYTPRNTTFPL